MKDTWIYESMGFEVGGWSFAIESTEEGFFGSVFAPGLGSYSDLSCEQGDTIQSYGIWIDKRIGRP